MALAGAATAQGPMPNAGTTKDNATDAIAAPGGPADAGSGREAELRSLEGTTATALTFANRGSVPVSAYWLNYEGRRIFYADIAPGKGHEQPTFLTHPWVVVRKSDGACLGLFLPTRSPSTVVIR